MRSLSRLGGERGSSGFKPCDRFLGKCVRFCDRIVLEIDTLGLTFGGGGVDGSSGGQFGSSIVFSVIISFCGAGKRKGDVVCLNSCTC